MAVERRVNNPQFMRNHENVTLTLLYPSKRINCGA